MSTSGAAQMGQAFRLNRANVNAEFMRDAIRGLSGSPKTLPCKYFYDERGSRLFDRICDQPEYYPTRTELSLLNQCGGEIAGLIGGRAKIIEFGTGSGLKTRAFLNQLIDPALYVPIDIADAYLQRSASKLAREYPNLEVLPVVADYMQPFEMPEGTRPARRTISFFPGSTIGNLVPGEVTDFFRRVHRLVGQHGALVIGVDLKKDPSVLHAAYNDRAGVTGLFNMNILERMNRELGAEFRPERFRHYAFYNPHAGRIEMHLVSIGAQTVRIGELRISFADGESIHTENSYKYNLEEFSELAAQGGFRVARVWTDAERLFSVQYLVAHS